MPTRPPVPKSPPVPDGGGDEGGDGGPWAARPGPRGTRFRQIRCYDDVDSTNRLAMDAARSGAAEGLVVTAEHQRAGRGRLGRTWEAPPGRNLLASIVLRPRLGPADRHLVTAMAALAAADAIAALAGFLPLVKWPNDLLAPDGRKLAGVLAEADGVTGMPVPGRAGREPGGVGLSAAECAAENAADPDDVEPRDAVVVGIGINVTWPCRDRPGDIAAGTLATASSLAEWSEADLDGPGPRAALLDDLLIGLERRLVATSAPGGPARLATELRSRCATIGRNVRVDLHGATLTGVAVDLTDEGHLVVLDSRGPTPVRTVVAAGDVVHLRAVGSPPMPEDPPPMPELRC